MPGASSRTGRRTRLPATRRSGWPISAAPVSEVCPPDAEGTHSPHPQCIPTGGDGDGEGDEGTGPDRGQPAIGDRGAGPRGREEGGRGGPDGREEGPGR